MTPPSRMLLVASLLGIVVLGTVHAGVARTADGPALTGAPEADALQILARSADASRAGGMSATMVIVTLGPSGPRITEVDLARDEHGRLRVADTAAWLLAADDAGVVFEDEAGRLLSLGAVAALPFNPGDAARTYDLDVSGRAELETGSALAVTFTRDGTLRERLFVDDRTGHVVRRETYDLAGSPVRVVALTSLDAAPPSLAATSIDAAQRPFRRRERVAPSVLEQDGNDWHVPTELPQGFELRAAYEVDGTDGAHLVYSDGLYTLSLFEQAGRVDHTALRGAEKATVAGMPVYRWPGAEPERMVWTGGQRTFTAVSDAPVDALAAAVVALPHDASGSLWSRVDRGLRRVGGWLWPFG